MNQFKMLHVRIPLKLHKKLKKLAFKKEVSLNNMINILLSNILEKDIKSLSNGNNK